jgi:hypothetical protein
MDILVAEELVRFLRRSELDKLLELLDVLPKGLCASEQIGLSPDRVATVMRAFYASLFSTMPAQFEKLQEPNLRERTRLRVAQEVAAAHAKLHAMVSQASNGYERSMLAHSVEEVRVLLGGSSAQ